MEPPSRPGLGAYLLMPILYYAAAKFGGSFTTSPEGMAIIWAPNAVLLASLLRYRLQGYWLFALLAIVAEIFGDMSAYSWHQAIFFGAVDVAEATLAYGLMRYAGMSPTLATVEDLAKFLLCGPVLATLAGGLLGASTLLWLGVAQEPFLTMARIWWFGDALGQVIVTPLLLSLPQMANSERRRLRRSDLVVGCYVALVAVLLGLTHAGSFHGVLVTPNLLLPAILYLAVRFPPVWSVVAVSLVSVAVAMLITAGRQPFGALPGAQEVMRGQEFILILAILGMGFAALMSQIRTYKRGLEAGVAERTMQLQQLNEELARQAQTDALTGLYNRRAFYEAVNRERERCARYGHPLSIILLDLDHFKSFNDKYGHLVGDQALCHFADVLSATLRSSDVAARYGGEEFVVLAPETDLEAGLQLAERLRAALRQSPLLSDGEAIPITASMGLTMLQGDDDVNTLLSRADRALYQAKAQGRDRIFHSL
jgi:diguanylate cyclase (GGDEF)-like protein